MATEKKIKELEKQLEELKKEAQKEEEMKEWFKSLLNGLKIELRDDRPESIYYKKNGGVIFELYQNQDTEERCFWSNYYLVWEVLRNEYELNEFETKEFIKDVVEQYLKLNVLTYGYSNALL
jgi:GTPase SAR1 family protein